MTSHEIRSTQNTRTKISSEQNDLKKLKSKHSAKLPTLKVLFSEWSDDDLLFVLEEANGDLDLAIDRISEGHANQWGEVKTKKSKKEAQKAKAATATISPHQTSSTITTYSPKSSTPSRPNNDRGNRSGKAPVASTRPRKTNSSWENKQDSFASLGGSWASIASTKGQNDTMDDSWNTPNTTDNWNATITTTTTTTTTQDNNNEEPNDDQPKTWASLLKSKPKTEAENEDINGNEASETRDEEKTANTDDLWNVPVTSNDGWNATSTTVNITTSTTDGWNATSEQFFEEQSVSVNIENSTKEIIKEQGHEESIKEEEKSSSNRLLHQEEPVVLPTSSDIAALDVKFGSLNVEEEPTETLTKETSVTTEEVKETMIEAPSAIPSAPLTNDANFAQSSYLKQQEAPATNANANPNASINTTYQQQQPQQTQQAGSQQGHPQQQPFAVDNLTSAYSSYLPNQPHTGASGFGMNPMSNLPDYSAYSTEAQRAAAAMGYYDPTAFNHHSPVTSSIPYQTRDKYTQETTSAQSQTVPQQVYPTNLPYYPYYYMPNQYNAYQQSAYGQPFMNKTMYPNMYQQNASGKPTAAQSPYSSPYVGQQQSQLYSQSMSGYDDLGLSDYQKSMYGQQGFLGQLNQQPTQTAQQSTQSTQKSEARTATTSQPPSGQQQQQQTTQAPLHHPYANNFFGQPQMFSYQQYPQYQQQMGHPQAAATNRHQQQYWNQ